MTNCIIVDDEPLAQLVLDRYVAQTADLRLVEKCANAIEAFNALEKQSVDLMFLDIKMPVINGIAFLKKLDKKPAVILTTGFPEFALDGFELDVVDYLLKPITFPRYQKAVAKFHKQAGITVPDQKDYIYVKVSGKLVKLPFAEIVYAESLKDYLKIVTLNDRLITHLTMKALVNLLPPVNFVRIHKSFIVNINLADSISRKAVILKGTSIPVGDNYKGNIDLL
jgi:two-component system LytT family response regulator